LGGGAVDWFLSAFDGIAPSAEFVRFVTGRRITGDRAARRGCVNCEFSPSGNESHAWAVTPVPRTSIPAQPHRWARRAQGRASEKAERKVSGRSGAWSCTRSTRRAAAAPDTEIGGARRLRRRVLHQRSHLRTKTCGRIQLDRRCLVIRTQKVKPFAPNFDGYVECIDCSTAPQHPHRGRDCRRSTSSDSAASSRSRQPRTRCASRHDGGLETGAHANETPISSPRPARNPLSAQGLVHRQS
jgi:hypothetical protein